MAAVRKPFHSTTNHTILFGPVSSQGKGTENEEYYCWLRNAAEGGLPNGLSSQGTWKDQDLSASNVDFGGCENLQHQYMRPRIREDLLPHDFSRWRTVPDCSVSPRSIINHENDGCSQQSSPVHAYYESSEQIRPSNASLGSPSLRSKFAEVFKIFHSSSSLAPSVKHSQTCQSVTPGKQGCQPAERSAGLAGSVDEAKDTVEGRVCSTVEGQVNSPPMAAVRGRGGGVDHALYQNLVEMIPLVETFMDQQGGRSSFLHRASLVYTPAPPRDPQPRKGVESPSRIMKPQPLRRASVINKHMDGKESSPRWEESENILRRVDNDGLQQSSSSYENTYQFAGDFADRSEVFFLRNQIEDLKRQLVEKDDLLQFAQQAQQQVQQAIHDAASQADIRRLQSTIDELQQELWEKDHIALNSQSQLADKQKQIVELQALLETLEANYHDSNDKESRVQEELNGLRCQVTALRYQLEFEDRSNHTPQSPFLSENANGSVLRSSFWEADGSSEAFVQSDECGPSATLKDEAHKASARYSQDYEEMECARRRYLAAIIAAREYPGDETFALVAELRMQLQGFLARPSFS